MILTVVIFTVDLENNHKKARLTNLEYLALSLSRYSRAKYDSLTPSTCPCHVPRVRYNPDINTVFTVTKDHKLFSVRMI